MDWFKWDANADTNEKVDSLTDGEFRAFLNMCGYAMRHENGGRVPAGATRLIQRVTDARITGLISKGFLHPAETGWVIHDWAEHQEVALKWKERKERDTARKREERSGG